MIESEIEISEDLVRDLLREQHPDLAGLPIREVAGGWGNQMWRLGDELAVRMQRMDRAPICSSRSAAGFRSWPRACRFRSRPRCGAVHRRSASPRCGPS